MDRPLTLTPYKRFSCRNYLSVPYPKVLLCKASKLLPYPNRIGYYQVLGLGPKIPPLVGRERTSYKQFGGQTELEYEHPLSRQITQKGIANPVD